MRSPRTALVIIITTCTLGFGTAAANAQLVPTGNPAQEAPEQAPNMPAENPIVVDWQVPKHFDPTVGNMGRFGSDLALANSYVNPPDGWPVTITTCASQFPAGTVVSSSWRVRNSANQVVASSSTCSRQVRVPQLGEYNVVATVVTTDGVTHTRRKPITIKDHLIVVAGDSMASGEGNPDVRGVSELDLCIRADNEFDLPFQCIQDILDILINGLSGAHGGTPATWLLDRDCHRSFKSGLSLAAKELEDRDPRSSVTYVNVACSGAEVDHVATSPYDGVYTSGGWDTGQKPPQAEQITRIICGVNRTTCPDNARAVDGLFLSAGVNDIAFSDVLISCAFPDPLWVDDCEDMKRDSVMAALWNLSGPGGELDALETQLRDNRNLQIREWYHATYPTGIFSPGQHGCSIFTFVGGKEVAFIDDMNDRLNGVVSGDKKVWRDPTADPWHGHGYCAGSQRWFVTLGESLAYHMGHGKAAYRGMMHPNAAGHDQLRREFLNEWDQRNRPVTNTVDVTFDQVQVTAAQNATSGHLFFVVARVGTDGVARYGSGDHLAIPETVDTRDGQLHELGANRVTVRMGLNANEQLRVSSTAGFILPPSEVECPPEYDQVPMQPLVDTGGGGGGGGDRVCLEANTMTLQASRRHSSDTGFGAGRRYELREPNGRFIVRYGVSLVCPDANPMQCAEDGPSPIET
ncbi:MAG: hypothetical protein ABWZ15_14435 [Acidimicrobiia bacterium]